MSFQGQVQDRFVDEGPDREEEAPADASRRAVSPSRLDAMRQRSAGAQQRAAAPDTAARRTTGRSNWRAAGNSALQLVINMFIMYASIKIWFVDAYFTLNAAVLLRLVPPAYKDAGTPFYGMFEVVTAWHLIPLAFSFVQWFWFPWLLHKGKVQRRISVDDWKLLVWLVVTILNVGTSFKGITDWMSTTGVIPIWGGISLPSEGIFLYFFGTVLAMCLAQLTEPVAKKALVEIWGHVTALRNYFMG